SSKESDSESFKINDEFNTDSMGKFRRRRRSCLWPCFHRIASCMQCSNFLLSPPYCTLHWPPNLRSEVIKSSSTDRTH
ncbi:hypothetical protein CEXT_344471, partial [Caerostris extrusa]